MKEIYVILSAFVLVASAQGMVQGEHDTLEERLDAINHYGGCRFCDLNGVDLSWRNLAGVNLEEANLVSALLRGAHLSRANLTGADLSGAELVDSNLNDASLLRANLTGANLEDASLVRASLNSADLSRANLTGANLSSADLSAVNNLLEAQLVNVCYNTETDWPISYDNETDSLFIVTPPEPPECSNLPIPH